MTAFKSMFRGFEIGAAIFALAAIALGDAAGDSPKTGEGKGAKPSEEVRLRGRVVCLAEEMHRLFQTHLPTPHDHLFGFRTDNGLFYTLLRTRNAEALFADKRVQDLALIVQARILPGTQILDATPVGSVHDGKVYELYYYCTVCAIKSIAPGPCVCCQQPVELVERPAGAGILTR